MLLPVINILEGPRNPGTEKNDKNRDHETKKEIESNNGLDGGNKLGV